MRAVVYDRYGPRDVLRFEEVERPVPGDDEILVRVHATTVNRTDCHRRGASPFLWRLLLGLRRPRQRVLGMEFAGVNGVCERCPTPPSVKAQYAPTP